MRVCTRAGMRLSAYSIYAIYSRIFKPLSNINISKTLKIMQKLEILSENGKKYYEIDKIFLYV